MADRAVLSTEAAEPVPDRASRLLAWCRGSEPMMSIAAAVVLATAVRLLFLGVPVYPDEGGYLLVARHWGLGGPFPYGNYFVDRPPLLLAFFRLADALGGVPALRLMGVGLAAVMVVAAGWAGWLVGALRGARWSAFVAAALMSSQLLGTAEVDGELIAVPLVLLGCVCVLAAFRPGTPPRQQAGYAACGGVLAVGAVLVKQNFIDALVFAGVLIIASTIRRRTTEPFTGRMIGAFTLGAGFSVLVTATWAVVWGTGLGDLSFALFGFRWQALAVIQSQSLTPTTRIDALFVLSVESGMASLAVAFLILRRRSLRLLDPLVIAVLAMLGAAVAGIALGASYWSHYLIQLVPAIVLATACLATSPRGTLRWARAAVAMVVSSSIVIGIGTRLGGQQPSTSVSVENALRSAANGRDSAFSFGHANLIEGSGLRPAGYPYMWGLTILVLDPDWTQLTSTLNGPDAPTWLLGWDASGGFGTGDVAPLRKAIASHYRLVADVCGVPFYLHDGVERPTPSTSKACSSG